MGLFTFDRVTALKQGQGIISGNFPVGGMGKLDGLNCKLWETTRKL